MKQFRMVLMSLVTLSLGGALLLHGCARGPRIDNSNLRSAAKSLDRIDKYLERFGTASVSSMLIVENKGQFALDYNQPTADYVAKARTGYQGAAQRFYQYAKDVQQAQVTQTDAEEVAKAALLGGPQGAALLETGLEVAKGLGITGAGPDTAAALIEKGEVEQGAPAFTSQLKPNAALAVLNSPTFSAPLPDITPPTELSERRALLIGVNDKITENILKYLAYPQGVPDNKLLYIGILEVSVNPGWGTREGYMADVVVTPEYARDLRTRAKRDIWAGVRRLDRANAAEKKLLGEGGNDEAKKEAQKEVAAARQELDSTLKAASLMLDWKGLHEGTSDLHDVDLGGDELAKKVRDAFKSLTPPAKEPRERTEVDAEAGKGNGEKLTPDEESLDGYYFPEDHMEYSGTQPVVLAAFPLLEAQTLDLRNSERTQDAFVSYLASLLLQSGVSQQNETLTSMVERLEYDSATRSPIPLVTSYASGDSFGFQFMPAFQALADPADSARGSANVLHPYSFPALVLLQCERSEVAPIEEGGLGFHQIKLNVSSRWIPMKDRRMDFPARYASRARIGVANELDRAIADLSEFRVSKKNREKYNFALDEAELRLRQVEPLSTGVALYSELPPYPAPPKADKLEIAKVLPGEGLYNAATVLTITGAGFAVGDKSLVKSVTVAGRHCEFVVAGKGTIVAVVPPWTTDITNHAHGTDMIASVVVATTQGAAESKESVAFRNGKVLHFTEPDPLVQVQRDAAGRVTGVTLNKTANQSAKLMENLRAIVEQEAKSVKLEDLEFEVKIK